MQCTVRDDNGFWVVTVAGEVDLSWSADVRRAILDGLDARRPVMVELSGVSYIDSSGVASFVEGYQRAKKERLQFGLVSASPAVLSVLKLSKLESIFPLHDDLPAAHAAGNGRSR